MTAEIFTVVSVCYIVVEIAKKSNIATFTINALEHLVFVGVVIQSLEFLGLKLHFDHIVGIQVCMLLYGIFVAGSRQKHDQQYRSGQWALLACSIFLIICILLSRFASPGQQDFALTGIGFFQGEDNAKWLNTAAEIASGSRVHISGVGGICVAFMSATAAYFMTLAPLVGYAVNEVSTTISTVVLASLSLILLLPLAFALSSTNHHDRSRLASFDQLIGVSLAVASSIRLLYFGHLTGQLFIFFGIALLSYAMGSKSDSARSTTTNLQLITLAVGMSSLWLPSQLLTGLLGSCLGAYMVITKTRRRSGKPHLAQVVKYAIIIPCSLVISFDTFSYTQVNDEQVMNLFSAGGGVPSYTVLERFGLIAACLIVLTSSQSRHPENNARTKSVIAALLGFGLLISYADYFTTGKFNYGTQKLEYMMISVVLPVLLAPAIRILFRESDIRNRSLARTAVMISLATGLTFNGASIAWIDLAKTSFWPSSGLSGVSSWRNFALVENSKTQSLDDVPIACGVRTPDPLVLSLDYNTYLCTRTLSSLAGLEREANALVEWQLRGDSDRTRDYLAKLPIGLLNRKVIVLEPDGRVWKTVPLQSFLKK